MITVYEQDNCGWCVRLKPHIREAAKQLNLPLQEINITGEWEKYSHIGFRSTPAVYLDRDNKSIEITSRTLLPLLTELKQYV